MMTSSGNRTALAGLLCLTLAGTALSGEHPAWVRDNDTLRDVPVRIVDGMALIDDIVLGQWHGIEAQGLSGWRPERVKGKRAAPGGNAPAKLWHGDSIPYAFDDSYNEEGRRVVRQAMALYRLQTGIRFVPRRQENHYVRFERGGGECVSRLGKVGGAQAITMNADCMVSLTDTLHHLGHTLGLQHAHQRPASPAAPPFLREGSMDLASAIDWQSDHLAQARKARPGYDLESVMHYDPHLRAGFDLRSVSTAPHYHPQWLSDGDVAQLASLYPGAARRAKDASLPREGQAGALTTPGGEACLGLAAGTSTPIPALVRCEPDTPRWRWDAQFRLRTDAAPGLCLTMPDKADQSPPRLAPCTTQHRQIWAFQDNMLTSRHLHNYGLIRTAQGKLAMRHLRGSGDAMLPSSLGPLWRWQTGAD
ncbi:M12 family metallopeptidase [Paludibacterium paludis]|uniref:Peptidase M12A domain-containing protein n=1 Tax=Paludibacterium paludis TaxID=1225769 RepID=A0A918NZ65_9NEIS|nr:M12 family metallopeptidase [Paludibacterium paludis]GGY06015.1 hypothetical protein GCM10011289_05540 [Paludibacterium paludis]